MPVRHGELSAVDACGYGVSRTVRTGRERAAGLQSGLGSKRPGDGLLQIGEDAVFHLDVLKRPLKKGDASDGAAGASTRNQMSLDLDDLW
jgi:hypothetical protein